MVKKAKKEDPMPEMSPLSNGLDFILAALESLSGNPSERQVKYGILHLSAGMLLILKERLRREHWSLVFDNIDSADRVKYAAGDFVSVNFEKTVKRLRGICHIPVPDAEYKILDGLRRQRNQIEHFALAVPVEAAKATAAIALDPIITFISEHMKSMTDEDAEVLTKIRELLLDFGEYVTARWDAISSDVEAHGIVVVSCQFCMQKAMVVADGGPKCLFCGHADTAERAAERFIDEVMGVSYIDVVKDGEYWPLHRCPYCSSDAFVEVEDEFVCFLCGEKVRHGKVEFCCRCNEPFIADDEEPMTICDDCFRERVESDD